MRAPRFWHRGRAGIGSALAFPLSLAWSAGSRIKQQFTRPQQCAVPVISIGNIVAGGAGKTPAAIEIAKRLIALGHHPHFISRGYGGRAKGPLRVDAAVHDASLVGDEALLLARTAPTWIARKRADAAEPAIAAGADVLVLDDAHQHLSLAKDFSFLVIDAEYGAGNGRIIPAGPLRESVAQGLSRADSVILINPAPMQTEPPLGLAAALHPLQARIVPMLPAAAFAGRRLVAFCGIARPEKFFASLEGMGAVIVARHEFADHHPFTPDEVMKIIEEANGLGAAAITTEKDQVRLMAEARAMVEALPVEARFADPEALDAQLRKIMDLKRNGQ